MTEKVISIDEQLDLMRKGRAQDLHLKMGDFKVPVQLMDASKQATVIAQAKSEVAGSKEIPSGIDRALFEAIEVQKAVLESACSSTPCLSRSLLDRLTHAELEALYDQYQAILNRVNPEFDRLSDEKILEMVTAVKKKQKSAPDFYTWQLAEIGRFFLETLQHKGNAAG